MRALCRVSAHFHPESTSVFKKDIFEELEKFLHKKIVSTWILQGELICKRFLKRFWNTFSEIIEKFGTRCHIGACWYMVLEYECKISNFTRFQGDLECLDTTTEAKISGCEKWRKLESLNPTVKLDSKSICTQFHSLNDWWESFFLRISFKIQFAS